jgi:hypothetical protein
VNSFVYFSSDRASRCFNVRSSRPARRGDDDDDRPRPPGERGTTKDAQPTQVSRELCRGDDSDVTETSAGGHSGEPLLEPLYSILLLVTSVAGGKLDFELRWPANSGCDRFC